MHARIVAFIPSPSSHECCHTIRTCCISIPMHNESSSNDEICYPIIPCSWRRLGSFPLYSHYTTDVACLNLVLRNQFSAQQFPLQSAGSSTPESTLFDPPIDDNKTVMSTMGRWEFLIKANEITDGRPDMKVRVKDEYFTNQVLLYLKSQRPLMLLRMHSNNVNHHFQVLDL